MLDISDVGSACVDEKATSAEPPAITAVGEVIAAVRPTDVAEAVLPEGGAMLHVYETSMVVGAGFIAAGVIGPPLVAALAAVLPIAIAAAPIASTTDPQATRRIPLHVRKESPSCLIPLTLQCN